MELAVELLAKILERREITVSFPTLDLTAKDLLESASYQALCQIQAILIFPGCSGQSPCLSTIILSIELL